MFKPNYDRVRADRRRDQQTKQEKKLRDQQEAVANRRAAKTGTEATIGSDATPVDKKDE
jgi:hypothetical protein